MKPFLRVALLAVAALGALPASATAQVELEQKVKAAFLFNFMKFVTWPPDREPAEQQPYVLCVVDDQRFTRTLHLAIRGKVVSGRPVEVRELAGGAPLRVCHLVWLGAGPGPQATESVLRGAAGGGVLTVHEAEAAVPSGVIRLFLDQQRIRFEVNTAAAEREHLQLSSRLLGVAVRVQVATPP